MSVTVVEAVVHFGDLKVALEFCGLGVRVDGGEFDTGDAGEVFPSLATDGGGHAGVVGGAGTQPALGGGLEVRLRLP